MWNDFRRWRLPAAAAVLAAFLVAGACVWLHLQKPRSLSRAGLDLRSGILFAHGEKKPFSGLLVEGYPRGAKKIEIEIRGGFVDGMSRGWFENGQMEIEEHFVRGVSDGRRTRWHANGRRRSTVLIAKGRFSGLYEEWHQNGRKAVEINYRNGKPDGEARAWAVDGTAKPPRVYRDGVAVSK
jgi:antitoxin component YwqK of YwqJK toxin-antitoxin module